MQGYRRSSMVPLGPSRLPLSLRGTRTNRKTTHDDVDVMDYARCDRGR